MAQHQLAGIFRSPTYRIKTAMKTLISTAVTGIGLFAAYLFWGNTGGVEQQREPDCLPPAKFEWNLPQKDLVTTLADLAKAQGLDPEDFRSYHSESAECSLSGNGGVSAVSAGGKLCAIAIETGPGFDIAVNQVVLLAPKGTILDRIGCNINSRYGTIRTEVLPKPALDGARVVIHFVGRTLPDGQLLSHAWHTIAYRGKSWTFYARWADEGEKTPNIWNREGLCRVGIKGDKFVVLFPKLEMPDVSSAKSLRVSYHVNGGEKELTIDNPRDVSALLSTFVIKSRRQGYADAHPKAYRQVCLALQGTRVEFVGTKQEIPIMAFVTNRILRDNRGWTITLDTTAFYKMLTRLVGKADGRAIDLLGETTR